jgi:hypothetical protein
VLKYKNNIELTKTLDIEDLKKILGYYEVDNWTTYINGVKKQISNINYYEINN